MSTSEDYDKEIRERLNTIFDFGMAHVTRTASQLTVWLLVGNGAGLLFLLNAIIDDKLPDAFPTATVYWLFLGGLGSAFVSTVIGLVMGQLTLNRLGAASASLTLLAQREAYRDENAGTNWVEPEGWSQLDENDRGNAERMMALNKLVPLGMGGVLTATAGSVVCLGLGISFPLFGFLET